MSPKGFFAGAEKPRPLKEELAKGKELDTRHSKMSEDLDQISDDMQIQTDPNLVERKAAVMAGIERAQLRGQKLWPYHPGFEITVNKSSSEDMRKRIMELASQDPEELKRTLESEMK